MKRLVLDTSGIMGINEDAFAGCRGQYEFLVNSYLLVELYTHHKKKEAFSKEQAALKAFDQFKKIASLPILAQDDLVRFEVEEGRSARECPHDKFRVPLEPFQPSDADLESMRERESLFAKMLDFKHPPECDAAFQELSRLQGAELWQHMTELLNNDNTTKWLLDQSVTFFMEMASHRGWKVSNNFCPDRKWLTFGAFLVKSGYVEWKFARHGDNVPKPASPANPSYDMMHVAHMAICDGILSTDGPLLNIAWACWPEKRDGLITYDQDKKVIVPYEPSWQKS